MVDAQFAGGRLTATSRFFRLFVQSVGARPRRAAGDRRRHFGRRDHRFVGAAEPRAAADREHHRRLVVARLRARGRAPAVARAREYGRGADLYRASRAARACRGRGSRRARPRRPADPVGVSFRAEPGKILGIIGPSGSGKTTLGKILVGALQPTVGTVRLDGARLTDWDQDELGKHIGYMPQEPSLFEGTIKENIARFARARQRRRSASRSTKRSSARRRKPASTS